MREGRMSDHFLEINIYELSNDYYEGGVTHKKL
jgi:hypothetical protein